MNEARKQEIITSLSDLSTAELKPALAEAIQKRPIGDQKDIANTLSAQAGIGSPAPGTRDRLWTIVVSAFAIVLVGGFIALALGVFLPIQTDGVKPEIILTTFTSVVGFLAGLFTPSPVAPKKGATE